MPRKTVVSLVRHGHVQNKGDIFYGRLPGFHLSQIGRQQAEACARVLAHASIAAIISSPLLRTRQTAAIIGQHHMGIGIGISSFLTEVHTPFDGQSRGRILACKGDIYSGNDLPFEQPIHVLGRAHKFIARVRKQYFEQHVVGVTHGELLALIVLWALGGSVDPVTRRSLRVLGLPSDFPALGSIVELTFMTTSVDEIPYLDYFEPVMECAECLDATNHIHHDCSSRGLEAW